MKNGTVIQTIGTAHKWYEKIVYWAMKKASGGPETHSQVWIDGFIYETSYPNGYGKKERTPVQSESVYFLVPTRELTDDECSAMKAFYEDKIRDRIKYATLKLLISFVIAFSRPVWEKLRWIPFQDDRLWGEYCSAAVDQAYKFAGIELLPGYEEITSPHDLTKSKFFRRT